MKSSLFFYILIINLAMGSAWASTPSSKETPLLPDVKRYVIERVSEFDQIPAEREEQLSEVADWVTKQREEGKSAQLTFICTHNSRRSHLAQLWAAVAASYYGIDRVETFSGGTEATAFNPRAVSAIKRVGMNVQRSGDASNPRYEVQFRTSGEPEICFSKVFSDPANPSEDFCAVMTCTSADEACPIVRGCSLRSAIPYEDPKAADDTPEEANRYDERCAQIGREMLYLFSLVKSAN